MKFERIDNNGQIKYIKVEPVKYIKPAKPAKKKTSLFTWLVAIVLVLWAVGYFSSNPGTGTSSTASSKREPSSSLDYKADIEKITAELQSRGYNVHEVEFDVSDYGKYVVSVYIDTKGNYDKEALAMYRIMYDNSMADYYLAMIVDYEFRTSWSFGVSRETLKDYFSGKISEQEYIHKVKPERIM